MNPLKVLADFHTRHGARLAAVQDFHVPLRYSSGLLSELDQMEQGAVLFDAHAFEGIRLFGPEASIFLQGMVTSDVKNLEIGQVQPSLICQNRGKIVFHLEIWRPSALQYWLLTDPGEAPAIVQWLEQFHIQEDFEIERLAPSLLRCDLLGTAAVELWRAFGGTTGEWTWKEQTLTTTLYPLGEIPRLLTFVPQGLACDFLQALLQSSPRVGLIGFEAYDQARLEQGLPRAGIDYGRENFPQEAALMDHISYHKGCYIGQEPHARMYHRGHPNWQLVQLRIPAALEVLEGQVLFAEGAEVGRVTSLGLRTQAGQRIGLAWVKYPIAQSGQPLALSIENSANILQAPLRTASPLKSTPSN